MRLRTAHFKLAIWSIAYSVNTTLPTCSRFQHAHALPPPRKERIKGPIGGVASLPRAATLLLTLSKAPDERNRPISKRSPHDDWRNDDPARPREASISAICMRFPLLQRRAVTKETANTLGTLRDETGRAGGRGCAQAPSGITNRTPGRPKAGLQRERNNGFDNLSRCFSAAGLPRRPRDGRS
jgi:hypothetical protein